MLKKAKLYWVLGAALVSGCATLVSNYEELYGPSKPKNRVTTADHIAAAGASNRM